MHYVASNGIEMKSDRAGWEPHGIGMKSMSDGMLSALNRDGIDLENRLHGMELKTMILRSKAKPTKI